MAQAKILPLFAGAIFMQKELGRNVEWRPQKKINFAFRTWDYLTEYSGSGL